MRLGTTLGLLVAANALQTPGSGPAAAPPKPAGAATSSAAYNLGRPVAAAALAAAAAFGVGAPALAENELTALGAKGFDSSLIDTQCFTPEGACGDAAQKCLETGDCLKGMTCTAKCLGDNACITGCFAKFGNAPMNELLECSIERHSCIKIAILPPGPDLLADAPAPPSTPVADFAPKTLEGSWYKVMGWNNRYDCFDCQRNSFTADSGDANAMKVDVEFSMPRPPRTAGGAPSQYPLRLSEKLVFDQRAPPSTLLDRPQRQASTRGKMFGLTFWENWSVLGESAADEPEFKFVHYSGRTSQNTYEGAFVYAREPELPEGAKKHVYSIARAAGMEPKTFCAVRNDAATCAAQIPEVGPDPGGPVPPPQKGLFMGAATAAELDESGLAAAERRPEGWLAKAARAKADFSDYVEDPHVAEDWLFSQQRPMGP